MRRKVKDISDIATTMKAAEKEQCDPQIIAKILVNMLVELHPKLPAYFCGSGSYRIYPLPISENIEDFMSKYNAVRLDPEGHVDIRVLRAIHNIIYSSEKNGYNKLHHPGFLEKKLEDEISNPNSELSQALLKAYGDNTQNDD